MMEGEIVLRMDYSDIEDFFAYAGHKARNLGKPLRDARGLMVRAVDEAFSSEGVSTGQPWRQLTESWARRRGSAHPILELEGTLRVEASLGSSFTIHSTADEASIDYALDLPYAAVQFFGGGPKNLPARPWLVETQLLKEQIEHVFADWLDDLKSANKRRANTAGGRPNLPSLTELVAW